MDLNIIRAAPITPVIPTNVELLMLSTLCWLIIVLHPLNLLPDMDKLDRSTKRDSSNLIMKVKVSFNLKLHVIEDIRMLQDFSQVMLARELL